MAKAKLTPVQKRVMARLRGGRVAEQPFGSVITINGERVCNVQTMLALAKKGLVEEFSRYYWRATEKGEVSDESKSDIRG